MLKGLDTFNVPIASTINSLPPALHQSFATASMPQFADIDVVRHLSFSDLVLTGSKQSGSVNVWSATLGMNLLGGFNFLKDLHKAQESAAAVPFKLSQFKGRHSEHNVTLITRRSKASSKADPV